MDAHLVGLGAFRPGDHACFPYEDERDKWPTLAAFIADGLLRNERCLYIGSPADQTGFVAALSEAGVDAQREIARGALVLATQGETYFRTGRFDADDMLDLLDTLVDRALADGYRGLRGTGEGAKALPDELWGPALAYEARVTERFARRPFTALCRYRAADVSPDRAQALLHAHPVALVNGAVCDNPFYERPEVAGDAHARLDWQLHRVRAHRRRRATGEVPEQCDLVTLVRESAARLDAEVTVEGPDGLVGPWDRETVRHLVATLTRTSALRGVPVTISVGADAQHARLSFGDGHAVELPRSPAR
jgi:hypothetical protein